MEWLNAHGGLAGWLAALLMILIAILQRKKWGLALRNIDWFRFVLYAPFLVTFGIMFWPTTEPAMRIAAGYVSGVLCGFIVVFRPRAISGGEVYKGQ